eukprot:1161498-Pelagomonas_calceolata.AAC.2
MTQGLGYRFLGLNGMADRSLKIWMTGSYDGHQRECLGGQCSNSVGIVACGPEGRPFFLELPGPIL